MNRPEDCNSTSNILYSTFNKRTMCIKLQFKILYFLANGVVSVQLASSELKNQLISAQSVQVYIHAY